MAILLSKEFIKHEKMVENLKNTCAEAKNLCDVVDSFLVGKTTRSQLNKELKKVRYMALHCDE